MLQLPTIVSLNNIINKIKIRIFIRFLFFFNYFMISFEYFNRKYTIQTFFPQLIFGLPIVLYCIVPFI